MRNLLVGFFVVVSLQAVGLAQVNLSILPTDRQAAWLPGIPGGVPSRTTTCATVNAATYGNGSADATAGIQNAINACPVGQVVQLSAGTFAIKSGPVNVNKSVVLRGAGPANTLLTAPDGTNQAVIVVGKQWPALAGSTNLTANGTIGTSSVTVASAAGLVAGQLVLIDKTTDTSITYWSADCDSSCKGWFSRTDRPLAQVMEISSVAGNTVNFTTPFHITFDTAHTAQLTTWAVAAVSNAGVEDLKVHGGEGGDGGGNIRVELAAYSWVKNVESEWSLGASLRLFSSFRCIIRDSYAHTSKDPNPGGAGYGIDISAASSDNLVENNISWNFNKVILMRASGGGNVIGYNYFEDGYGAGYKSIVETGLNASHMTTPHYELFEGNEAFNFGADARWGNSVYITFFRNHSTTLRRSLGGLGLTDANGRVGVQIGAYHYWYTFIGNVIGYSGMTPSPYATSFTYQNTYPFADNPVPMWRFGVPDATADPGLTYDPQVLATALRDGNYDYATNSVHWDRTAQTIPNSLYLTAKPAFFGTAQWPWVDPTGTTKLYVLPARQRFDVLMGLAPAAPTAPTNLRIVGGA